MKKSETMKVENISLSLIDRPAIPDRLSIDPEYIKELAASIAEIGLLSPLLLRSVGGRFEIVSGDCRYQAFLSLGRDVIPAFVQELDAESVSISRATENLQRKDLSIIEEARIYKNLHDNYGMSWDQISKRTGKTPGLVKRRHDLLDLPEILVTALHEKKIGYTVAEELSRLKNPGKLEYYLGFCIDHGATQRVVVDWVKDEVLLQNQQANGADRSHWGSALPALKPVYVPCDLCTGPMVIGTERMYRCCEDCAKQLNEITRQQS